jgi:NAD-dependent histone deacetylase SIR2
VYAVKNYTQNIDTLETRAGVRKVLQCHGSFATASCLNCRRRVDGREIESEILSGKVPLCVVCNTVAGAQLKKGVGKRSKKKKKDEWDSDCEDESDGPEYPPGIMKVRKKQLILVQHLRAFSSIESPILRFLGKSSRTNLIVV